MRWKVVFVLQFSCIRQLETDKTSNKFFFDMQNILHFQSIFLFNNFLIQILVFFSCMDNVTINSRGSKFHFYFMTWRANRLKGSQGNRRGTLWQIKTVDYKKEPWWCSILFHIVAHVFLNKLGKGQIIWWEHFWQTSRSKNKH